MDFSRIELSDEDRAFRQEARSFLGTHMTEEVRRPNPDVLPPAIAAASICSMRSSFGSPAITFDNNC